MDRIETNFRLSQISQRETNAKLNEVGTGLKEVGTHLHELGARMEALAAKVDAAADRGEETANRLEDSILALKSFADGQVEIRTTLAEHARRLDDLEGKEAS